MTTTTALSVADRIILLLDHLNLEQAHFASRSLGDLSGLAAPHPQSRGDHLAHRLFVVDDQNAATTHDADSSCRGCERSSCDAGKKTENVLPRSGSLSTVIQPSCSWTMP